MKILYSFNIRKTAPRAPKTPAAQPVRLTRTFVETGDERCPIAGIWMSLPDTAISTDEPELVRPAMGTLLPWQASHHLLTAFCYSAA